MAEIIDQNMNSGPAVSTRSVGIKYGLFMGVVGIAYFVILEMAGLSSSEGVWRWLSFIYIFAFLYLGQKAFIDNGNGFMTYGQGMGITFWEALISSLISSVFTFVYVSFIDKELIPKAIEKARQGMEEKGTMSDEQIDQAMAMTSSFMTPVSFFIFGLIFGIIFIMIAGLIVSAITQKRNPNEIPN